MAREKRSGTPRDRKATLQRFSFSASSSPTNFDSSFETRSFLFLTRPHPARSRFDPSVTSQRLLVTRALVTAHRQTGSLSQPPHLDRGSRRRSSPHSSVGEQLLVRFPLLCHAGSLRRCKQSSRRALSTSALVTQPLDGCSDAYRSPGCKSSTGVLSPCAHDYLPADIYRGAGANEIR